MEGPPVLMNIIWKRRKWSSLIGDICIDRMLPAKNNPVIVPSCGEARLIKEELVMASDKRGLYINGEWVTARGKAVFPVYNPATGDVWRSPTPGGPMSKPQ
jgi:hypothetical protein